MLKFVWQKLLHKKWLNMCSLMGMVLLISVVAGNTLYQGAALNKLLQSRFDDYIGEKNAYPARISAEYPFEYQDKSVTVTEQGNAVYESVLDRVGNEISLAKAESIMFFASDSLLGKPQYQSDDSKQDYFFMPAYLEGIEGHIALLRGTCFTNEADEEGIYECIINERMVQYANLSVGDVITFPKTETKNGEVLRIRVAGIFKESDVHDCYWVRYPNDYEKILFVSEAALDEIMENRAAERINMTFRCDVLLDYEGMSYKQTDAVKAGVENVIGNPPVVKMSISSELPKILSEYQAARSQVKAIMQTLQIPVLALLMVFLFMVSSHITELEQGEIAMLRSRGVSNGQIVGSYFAQSVILATAGCVVGVPLGYGFAMLLGSANAFMEFVGRESLQPVIDGQLLTSVLLAVLTAVLFMTLPVLQYTTLSIVEVKQKKNRKEKTFWQKYYLDVLMVIASLYIRYNLSRQKETIALQIVRGESMDPVLFLSSVLFILGCGMFFLRILQLIIRLIYRIGKRRFKPAAYVSFLQIMKAGKKQNFISVFLILTIAMGIFYANTARTMNTGLEERIRYNIGAGAVSSEQWANNLPAAKKNKTQVMYEEPDFVRYESMQANATKVIRDYHVRVYYGNQSFEDNQLMAIHTREFGKTAWMKNGVLNRHWYHYLNDISQVPNGVLVSANFGEKTGAKIGDTIKYVLFDDLKNTRAVASAKICGFVDVWPGYSPYEEQVQADGSISYRDSYLIVANYSQVVTTFGATPYEVWYDTQETGREIRSKANEAGIELLSVASVTDELVRSKNDASIQVTNGLLTISFLVILILCMAGFLIHWILTIRKRELMLGIYRAMGMKMSEVRFMLIHEQIFASVSAIVAGAGVGFLASYLYIPLIMVVYLPGRHALATEVISSSTDIIRIAGILAVMLAVCFVVLAKVVSGMKIAQALKLGED